MKFKRLLEDSHSRKIQKRKARQQLGLTPQEDQEQDNQNEVEIDADFKDQFNKSQNLKQQLDLVDNKLAEIIKKA